MQELGRDALIDERVLVSARRRRACDARGLREGACLMENFGS
jgi:hypothetical protein